MFLFKFCIFYGRFIEFLARLNTCFTIHTAVGCSKYTKVRSFSYTINHRLYFLLVTILVVPMFKIVPCQSLIAPRSTRLILQECCWKKFVHMRLKEWNKYKLFEPSKTWLSLSLFSFQFSSPLHTQSSRHYKIHFRIDSWRLKKVLLPCFGMIVSRSNNILFLDPFRNLSLSLSFTKISITIHAYLFV